MSARLLAGAGIAVFLTAGCGRISRLLAQTAAHDKGDACALTQLRVARAQGETGIGGPGGDWIGLVVRFVNDGRACTFGRRLPLAVTATTNTHVVIRAKLHRRLRLAPREAVEVDFGWFSATMDGSRQLLCRSTLGSVVFHSGGTSKTVSLRHVRFFFQPFCTPVDYVGLTVIPTPQRKQ